MLKADFDYKKVSWEGNIYVHFFSIVKSENTISFLWDFGDGKSSTDVNPHHNYLIKGIYKVELNVVTAGNEIVTIEKEINIEQDYIIPNFSNQTKNENNKIDNIKNKRNIPIGFYILGFIIVLVIIVACFPECKDFINNTQTKIVLIIMSIVSAIVGFVKKIKIKK